MTTPLPNEHEVHPTRRLGWRGPTNRASLIASQWLTGLTPEHPATADHMSRVPTWNGRTNFKFGTCGPCSYANFLIMSYKYLKNEDITVADNDIYDLYRRSGNPAFSPITGAGDSGVDMNLMLNECRQNGMRITHADGTTEIVRVAAFGQLTGQNQDLIDEIRATTALFGGVLFGASLQIAQQDQTDAKPPVWDYIPGSPNWGGHAIFGGSYSGVIASDEEIITWLVKAKVSDAFWTNRLQEAYLVILPIALASPPIQAGIEWSALAADYLAMTGQAFPFPLPVDPPPDDPPAPPAEVPTQADLDLNKAILPWLGYAHTGRNAGIDKALRAWQAKKGLDR